MEAQLNDPTFWNAEALSEEFTRVADICHGCRRCFNLCPSFSILFNRIDAVDGEMGQLAPAVADEVVDACFYCKLCYNHCPYTPPHDFRLDFPLLMVRGKAVRAQTIRPRWRDRLLVKTDFIGTTTRWLAPVVNRLVRIGWFREILHRWVGIHRGRWLPPIAFQPFPTWFRKRPAQAKAGVKHVALFSGCLTNYNYPEVGRAAVQVLEKNGVEVVWPDQQCCGMPYFDTGDFDALKTQARANVASLKAMVDRGYPIVSPIPSCSLMLKKEYPALLASDDARLVAKHTFDICEYLMLLHQKGELSTDFTQPIGTIAYQIPCHLRDQNIGYKSRDLMQLIPDTRVELIEKCSGHDGSWSVKVEWFDASMQVGQKAFQAVRAAEADTLVSDCPLSGLQLEQGTGQKAYHPIQIIHRAYGLDSRPE
ncbi:MAG: anaerobic glycerol-3-phosphate dehydrogenase subunit C [Nitrospiria bacterium]